MADCRAIMTLVLQGRSYRDVVAAVGCSHRDVAAARKTIAANGITATGLAQMSDTELAGLFPDGRSKVSDLYVAPNRIDKLIRQAGLPIPTATIAEIDYREGRGINPTRMRRCGNHDWRSEPTNLLVTSPTGGGKTYLVCAIGIAACHREHDVAYLRLDDLARRLIIARADGIAHQNLLTQLSDTDLPIIDDFLTVGIDPEAASDLFAILANREHRLPTLIASHSGPD